MKLYKLVRIMVYDWLEDATVYESTDKSKVEKLAKDYGLSISKDLRDIKDCGWYIAEHELEIPVVPMIEYAKQWDEKINKN